MKPRHYMDLDTLAPTWCGLPAAAARILKHLHACFVVAPGRYAVALPDHERGVFRRLRVFGSTPDELAELRSRLGALDAERFPARCGPAVMVPEDFAGRWLSYARYRIPTRKQERHVDGTLRMRRIQQADARALPFFSMRSASNGQVFRLYVEIQVGEPLTSECRPDSYGLSVATRRFALPDL